LSTFVIIAPPDPREGVRQGGPRMRLDRQSRAARRRDAQIDPMLE
jgi:hypothetical protein